ncbi:hypothetical protein DICPUDRAFT_154060 [Dictyostelium purpureum]|uniref:EGF-like domain-containing protein n=1 Tax=Dictyostelium purpureum TaxID=5786 RepID=F0ZQH1_DICPU|nr:uncharacterized protein DICPUDRAFT_154060 [Dictyostelium purpureum]EGC33797.1 hypothetical protein DICPUDRAFT_154060 [Dictyostelium purpureum]|eukprot:XP_003289668.1 hypothetical protein DICPUDRAFT_154060 [Dictyostelium purpureum]
MNCNLFSFLYLICDSGEFEFKSNDVYFDPYFNINPVLVNDTATIFEIEIKEIPIGVYTHNFVVTGSSTYYFDIHYECVYISVRGMELDINGMVSAVFKYDNLKTDFYPELYCEYCYIRSLSKYYFLISLSFNFIIPEDLNKTVEYYYNDIVKSVSFKSYYDPKVIDEITDLTFPNSDYIQKITYALQPVFTYYSNNTNYYKPIHSLAGGEGYGIRSDYFVSRPISSKDGRVKYIGFIDNTMDTATFSLLSQKLDNIDPVFTQELYIDDPLFQSFSVVSYPIQETQSITIHFEYSWNQHDFYPFQVEYFNSVLMKFPFGFQSGNLFNYKYNASFFLVETYLETSIKLKYFSRGYNEFASFAIESLDLPADEFTFENVQYIHLYDDIFILRIQGLSKSNPIYKWTRILPDATKQYFYLDGMVSGSIMDPTYDFLVSMYDTFDEIGPNEGESYLTIKFNQYYDIKNIKYFAHPSFNDEEFDYFDITFAKILYSEIDVTNKTAGNILYFNISNINQNTPVSLVLYDPIRQGYGLQKKDFWPATWNSYLELFQIEFFVKANSHPGKIPYSLFFDKQIIIPSSSLPDDAQFTIISKNEDLYGPIIDNYSRFPNEPLPAFFKANLMSDKVATWNFNIIDEINGFRDGYIVIMGDVDGSKYNFSLSPYMGVGDKYNASYSISIALGTVCASQTYTIVEVLLFDEQGNNSTFSLSNPFQSYDDSLSNPFINFLNTDLFYNNVVICDTFDDSPPVLLEFELVNAPDETNPIDVGSFNRLLNFKISANDSDSGFKVGQSPIIYLSTSNLRTHECYSNGLTIEEDLTYTFVYECQIPLGFGYPHGIQFSIYNFINQGGTFGGYSNYDLKQSGLVSGLAKESIVYSLNHPIISGGSRVSTDGGDLWIYGRGFANVSSVYLKVEYILGKNRQLRASPWLIPLTIKKNLFSALHISGIPKGTDKFSLVFDYLNIMEYQDPFVFIPSEKVLVSQEDLPVNPSQECLGTPQCGGSSRGYCSNTGCVCTSPYAGKDCLDTVIIIPESPLSLNITDPIAQLNTDLFKSLISLVSIREIDVYDKVVFEHKFEKWTLNQISNDTNDYHTTVGKSTLVKARLQWFSKETIIKFADQQINMNPSSVKYNIEIVDYPFASKLNSLELVIKASLETLDSTCSAQEFGYTTSGDNMEYMKIQIDDHSLYGRFIRRGVFDELKQVKAITIRIIPDNSTTNSKSFSSTLIGIRMAYFSKRAIIDPDFSVLLDSSRVDKKSNSICSNKGSNKLSGSKIAGIVIGCVAFVAIVIVCIIYNHHRKKQQKEFVASMQQKLKQIN